MSAIYPADWPPALALLVDLAAGDPEGAGARRAGDFTPADWTDFADLAVRRHRVAPLLGGRPTELPVPESIRNALADAARDAGQQALARMAETRRISARFEPEGVAPVVLKGWPLALRLFGSAALRQGRDLDLHVPQAALGPCHAAMLEMGYVPTPEHELRARLVGSRALFSECHEIEYVHPASGLVLELGWRGYPVRGYADLFDTPGAIEVQDTPIGPVRVPSASVDMIYLSVHGWMHMWSRLKWLVDIDRLARQRGAKLLEQDLAAAQAADVGTSVALGLLLASRLFGSPLPPALDRPEAGLERAAASVLRRLAVPERELARLPARLDFYRFAVGHADTAKQRLGFLRFGAWRRLRLRLAELAGAGQRSAAP